MSTLLPVALDLARLKVAVVGDGPRAARRIALLGQGGARDVLRLRPDSTIRAFAGVNLVFIADLHDDTACAVATRARASGALVNVEDVTELCDFHSAAVVRRGDLALGIWTNGACPMLARVLKEWLERVLPADFARVVDALARQRDRMRQRRAGRLVLELAATRAVQRLPTPPLYPSPN